MAKRDVVTAREAAEIAGVSAGSFRTYTYRDQAPPPEPGFDPETGKKVWSRKAIEEWAAHRPGRGARTDVHGKGWTTPDTAEHPAPEPKSASGRRSTARPQQSTRRPARKKSPDPKRPAPE